MIKLKRLFNRKKATAGFTLVEVVVSVALLAIVLTILADGLMMGLSFLNMARNKTQRSLNTAGGVAQAAVSAGTNTYSSSVSVGSSSAGFSIDFGGGDTVSVPGSYYTGKDGDVTYKNFVPAE